MEIKKYAVLFFGVLLHLLADSQIKNTILLQEKEGLLAANNTDTSYARVLPNEVLIVQAGIQGSKGGAALVVEDMKGNILFKKAKFKNLRKALPLHAGQDVVRILLINLSD